jgi:hypothetical protein
MAIDAGGDGDDRALRRQRDSRLLAAVDQPVRHMEEQIDDPAFLQRFAAEQPGIKRACALADAGQRG